MCPGGMVGIREYARFALNTVLFEQLERTVKGSACLLWEHLDQVRVPARACHCRQQQFGGCRNPNPEIKPRPCYDAWASSSS